MRWAAFRGLERLQLAIIPEPSYTLELNLALLTLILKGSI